jgi:hypothetical protein
VRHSVYCLATDVLDEGAGKVLDNISERAGVGSVTVAAKYHAVSDIYPHNPLRKVATLPPGVFYHADLARYSGAAIKPSASPAAQGRDVLQEVLAAATPRQMGVAAWAVMFHHDEGGPGMPALQVNCFGDEMAGTLCPSHPGAQRFAELLVDEISSYPVGTVRLESLHFHGINHGHHHERLIEPYGATALFALGLCFCRWCLGRAEGEGNDARRVAARALRSLEQVFDGVTGAGGQPLDENSLVEFCGDEAPAYLATRRHTVTELAARLVDVVVGNGARLSFIDPTIASIAYASGVLAGEPTVAAWQFGIDLDAVRQAGADVEVTGYLRSPLDLERALSQYRRPQSAPTSEGSLAVVLRPGAPDCQNAEDLRSKLAVAASAGSAEVNFYNYGLYRAGALGLIGSALA